MSNAVRVFIAMSDTGGGHRAIANAISGSLCRRYGGSVDVQIEDVFSLPRPSLFERITRLYGTLIRHAPWFYGWLYHSLNGSARYRAFGAIQGPTVGKMTRLLESARPDVIINTHPLANRPLLDTIDRLGTGTPVLASVTELVSVHASWVDPRIRLYNTATLESYSAVLGWGACSEIVRCAGLPVAERFATVSAEKADVRGELGLDRDRFTALLIGGGEGAGGLRAIVQAIQLTDLPIQLIVVCGRNAVLKRRLEEMKLRTPAHICGFVKTIPELMCASDVVITKGGPGTIAESLIIGRPVILSATLPGQEEGNGKFVESRGVGFKPAAVRELIANLTQLVQDPDLRAWM